MTVSRGDTSSWQAAARWGSDHPRVRLVEDAFGASGGLAAQPQDRRSHHARFQVRHVAGLEPRLPLLLQRLLCPHDPRSEAPLGAGRSAREVWPEIWDDIGPRAESVIRTGQATWDEGLLLFLDARVSPTTCGTIRTSVIRPGPSERVWSPSPGIRWKWKASSSACWRCSAVNRSPNPS